MACPGSTNSSSSLGISPSLERSFWSVQRQTMSCDAHDLTAGRVPRPSTAAHHDKQTTDAPRMRYRNRPVSVAVDPISLVISECISITSAIQKYTRSPHSSVSAILGGSPNPLQLASPSLFPKSRIKNTVAAAGSDDSGSDGIAASNRWGLRGQKSSSMRDISMVAGFGKLRRDVATVQGMLTIVAALFVFAEQQNRHPGFRRPCAPGPVLTCYTD